MDLQDNFFCEQEIRKKITTKNSEHIFDGSEKKISFVNFHNQIYIRCFKT
nr:hypothetical protein [uncultured bacterium]